ncbi:MAG: hypothetical protein ACTSPG_01035 [Candidatus Hodarchaeales archaeon]
MNDYETYIHYGRLIVVLQFIFIPIYFYILSFIFVDGVIWFFDTPELKFLSDIIIYGIGPLVMSVPFFMWTYGRRYQIGDAYETFGREVWNLPITIKAFYGFNFIIGMIYLFPIITPAVSLFGGYFIAVYIFKWKEEGKLISTQRRTILATLLYLPIPLMVVMGFYFGYNTSGVDSGILAFFLHVISLWTSNVDFLYNSALILADSATIGGVLYLIYEGAQQVDYTVNIPVFAINLISGITFIILESLYIIFPGSFEAFLGWIHITIVIIGIIMLLIRFWKGLLRTKDTSITGWLTLVVFQLVNFASGSLETISRSTAILFAFTIFLALFWQAYQRASKRY